MPNIQVLNLKNQGLGKGNGDIDAKAKTATIHSWTNPAGLQTNHEYKLQSEGKVYSARCSHVGTSDPVAQFTSVE